MSPTGRESDKFMLRLPDGMRDSIKASAEKNGRSMNAEIVSALELYLGITTSSAPASGEPTFADLRGEDHEEQIRRIVESSARDLYQKLRESLNSKDN